jgi:NAD(P)-dependent dehydrogenase (short-subunit alcohol dehydrogenase family)
MTDQTQDSMVDPRVVLVTGAASGMGLATGRRFLAGGCRVVAWDVAAAQLADAWSDTTPSEVLTDVVDVSDPVATEAGAARLLDAFGRLDVVVNNAALHGAEWQVDCLTLSPEQWRRIVDVNFFGPINVLRSCADPLAAAGGVVVNISSMVAYGHGRSSPYSVTKTAVNGLTTSLAEELGRRGVRVVGVAPGFVATDTVVESVGPDRMKTLIGMQSLPTVGQPGDIAEVTYFLASEQARMITGQTVVADLGITRRP